MRSRTLPIIGVLIFSLTAGSANATGGVSCSGINSNAYVEMVFGAGPVANILDIGVSDGKRVISSRATDNVETGHVAQSYSDGSLLQIDLMDDQVTKKLATIKILRVGGGDWEDFQIGYLQIEENEPIAIRCEGP
ncbi:MAG: hypothetical protein AAF478_00600 [Pseudomonadota bacterium]